MDRHWKHAKEVGSCYVAGEKREEKEQLSYINMLMNTINIIH